MGADMMLSMAPVPVDESGATVLDLDRLCERIRERVRALGPEGIPDVDEYEDILELPDTTTLESDAAAVVEALSSWLRAGGLRRRDVTWVRVGGREWIATGGMSWGDAPTDAYSYVGLLDAIGAFDAPFPTS